MRSALKNRIKNVLKRFDIAITRYSHLQQLYQESRASNVINLLRELPDQTNTQLLALSHHSTSQFGQDLFALLECGFKRNGYFVEFGATNGVDLSNSLLLEREFGWSGILAEPARRWHRELRSNRHCHIETNCVWSASDSEITFEEADWGELSGARSDNSPDKEGISRTYAVRTISLLDLLDKYGAPQLIDYLSIDTEGSEYEILRTFDFDKYRFKVITCEHNHEPRREQIFSQLTANGYVRKFEKISNCDDWYVLV
jgi:FkbM family methyltransferase